MRCGSLGRHRALLALIDGGAIALPAPRAGRVLFFAPEACFVRAGEPLVVMVQPHDVFGNCCELAPAQLEALLTAVPAKRSDPTSPPASPARGSPSPATRSGQRAARSWGVIEGVSRHLGVQAPQHLFGPLALRPNSTRVGTHALQVTSHTLITLDYI
jgi:hypothetical protein